MAEDLAEELEAYAAAWSRLATDGIADFWRRDHFRFYKAEDMRELFTEFPGLLAYWRNNEKLHDSVWLEFHGVLDLGIPGPARLVSAQMEWRIAYREDALDAGGLPYRHAGKATSGWNHVLSLWEEVDGRWYLTGWCEAPDRADLSFRPDLSRGGRFRLKHSPTGVTGQGIRTVEPVVLRASRTRCACAASVSG